MPDSDISDDRDVFMERLGVVLVEARKWSGWNQAKAAAALDMNPATLTRWEHGSNKISAYDLVRLIRLYGLDPDLAVNPPASRVEIRKRLGPVSDAARAAVRRATLRPLDDDDNA